MQKSHYEILENIWKHKEVLEKALGLPYVWVQGKEVELDPVSEERADLVFRDMLDLYKGLPESTCFILELKRDKGDHELLGQLKKYMDVAERLTIYNHWGKVQGIAVAPDFSDSCLRLLWKEKIRTFIYSEKEGKPVLTEKKIQRKALLTSQQMRLFDECSF